MTKRQEQTAADYKHQRKENSTKPQKEGSVTKVGIEVGKDKVVVVPDEVQKLAALWCTYKEMADWFGINVETLKYNFHTEIELGRSETKQALRKTQIDIALKGDRTMLIWLGKNILQQSDNPNDTANQTPLPWVD